VRNEIKTERNETKRSETEWNETKSNETEPIETRRNKTYVIFLDLGEILEKGVHESSVCDTGLPV
jgi:hypothetical protein